MRSERWRYHSMLNCDSIYRDRSLKLSIDLIYPSFPLRSSYFIASLLYLMLRESESECCRYPAAPPRTYQPNCCFTISLYPQTIHPPIISTAITATTSHSPISIKRIRSTTAWAWDIHTALTQVYLRTNAKTAAGGGGNREEGGRREMDTTRKADGSHSGAAAIRWR